MTPKPAARERAPTHPGEVLREDVLPALGMSVMAAAKELGVTRQHLHRILAGRAPVTPDMAVRLGKFCGNGARIWLQLQIDRDLWEAERRLAPVVAGIRTRRARGDHRPAAVPRELQPKKKPGHP